MELLIKKRVSGKFSEMSARTEKEQFAWSYDDEILIIKYSIMTKQIV